MHNKRQYAVLVLLLCLFVASVFSFSPSLAVSEWQLILPASVRPGDPFLVVAHSEQCLIGTRMRIYYANGTYSPEYPAFRPLGDYWWDRLAGLPQSRTPLVPGERFHPLSLFNPGLVPLSAKWPFHLRRTAWLGSVHPDASAGLATIRVYSGLGAVLAESTLMLQERRYISETLRLNAALTSIRADPDPLKDEQAKRYLELLAQVNPGAVYLDAPFVLPLDIVRRTSFFGDRRLFIYSDGRRATSMHAGVDYGAPTGTPLRAAGRGLVVMAEDRIVSGKTVVLEHLPGLYSIYMHLDSLTVVPGQLVERGANIGTLGATGLATGPHLHWELRLLQIPVDPEAMLTLDNIYKISTIPHAIEGR